MADMSVQTTFSDNPAIGYAGMLDSNVSHDVVTMVNVEASASMPFGKGIVFKQTSPVTAKDALLPAAQTDVPVGILVHSHNYARTWTNEAGTVYGELDSTGVKPGAHLNVLRRGRILVVCTSGCEIGDKLYIRCTNGSGGTAGRVPGDLENASDSTFMIDATATGTWVSNASAGGLAWLDVKF
jgi:hypothetical protein